MQQTLPNKLKTHNCIKLSIMFWTESFSPQTAWQTGTVEKYAAATKTPNQHQNPCTKVAAKLSQSMLCGICFVWISAVVWCVGFFFFFISAASDFKLNLRCCIYSKNSGIVTAQHYRLCSHQPTPFLSPLFSRSISLTPFSLSGCTSACRSGYLIHVQRHRFLILWYSLRREADQTCLTLGIHCPSPQPPHPSAPTFWKHAIWRNVADAPQRTLW